jgi:hypothetical protein
MLAVADEVCRRVGISFFALAAYVSVESVRALLGTDRAEHSTVGLVIAAVAVKEGCEAWRGDTCCAPAAALRPASGDPTGGCTDDCCTPEQER